MQARRARVTRGVLAAAVSTFAAAFSHGAVSGQAPSVVALAVASVIAVGICVALAGRLTPVRLVASVLLSQIGFHVLFALAPAASGTITVPGHHGMVSVSTDAVMHVHSTGTPAMWLGHAVAAIVTVLALGHGEQTFLALCDTLRMRISEFAGVPAPVPVRRPAPALPDWPAYPGLIAALLTTSHGRRGPPRPVRPLAFVA